MIRGFTILELIVVLALTSILAGMSALAYQAMRPALNLSMAARQVVMDLKVARVRAVTEHVTRRVRFAAGGDAYQHQRQAGSAYSDDGAPVHLPPGIVVRDCTAADDAVSFRSRGNAGSFGTITLQNAAGGARAIVVDIAGQVRMP